MRHVGSLSFGSLLMTLAACGEVQEAPAQVSVVLSPSVMTTATTPYFGDRSTSGLVTNGFCYFFNVTAPDLMNPNVEVGDDTCGHGPKGLGATFGAFSYGKTAVLSLSPGQARRFDLLGFKIPDGTSQVCEDGKLQFVVSNDGSDSKVQVLYDGVEIGADPESAPLPDPNEDLYIFSRSQPVTLTTGAQTVTMTPIEYEDRTISGIENSFPKRYDCKTGSGLVLSENSWNFGTHSTNQQKTIRLTNGSGVTATGISVQVTGTAFEEATGTCSATLSAGASCYLIFTFKASAVAAGPYTGTVDVSSVDAGSAEMSLSGTRN